MKVAIFAENLLKRDHYVETVEAFCELFEIAPIYTFAHNVKRLLGPIEQRKIFSTYLSQSVVDEDDFNTRLHHIPHLANSFHVDCDTELIFSISKGYCHGIKKPKKAKHICLLYDFDYSPKGLMAKAFGAYTKQWMKKSFANVDVLLVMRDDLRAKVEPFFNGPIEDVLPVFNIKDYPKLPEGIEKDDYYILHAQGLDAKAMDLVLRLVDKGLRFKIIGNDFHLKSFKKQQSPALEFWGERCAGDLQGLFAKAQMFVDLGKSAFPQDALASLAMGTPVVMLDNLINRSFIKADNAVFINSWKDLESALKINIETTPQSLRRNALRFNETKLKMALKQHLT